MYRSCFAWIFGLFLLAFLAQPGLANALLAGPMVGATDHQGSKIWAQTRQASQIQIKYWPAEQPDQVQWSPKATTDIQNFYTAQIPLSSLKANTRYDYEIWLNQQAVKSSHPQYFSTAPAPQAAVDFKVLFGSCYFVNDEMMDLLNLNYGSGYEIFSEMTKQNAALMFWMGDNAYYGPYDLANVWSMNRRMRAHRSAKFLQPFLATTSHLAIWDDHDFGPNNSDREFPLKKAALDVFQNYWANPQFGLKDNPGVYFKTRWGDAEFFFTDNRYYRAPMSLKDPKKDFFGQTQLNWLKQALKTSQATFKLIAVGSPVLNRNYKESFYEYPGEFQALLNFIQSEKIEGVVFISGDRHHTDLVKMERAGAYPLYNFTASPLTTLPTQILNPGEGEDNWRIPGTLIQERNFGVLEFGGPAEARQLTLRSINTQGQVKWEYTIQAQNLSLN